MQIRYHAWMTRNTCKAEFTFAEHVLYASMALGLLAGVIAATILAFNRPSIATLALEVAALVFAWWVMSQTPRAPIKHSAPDAT